MPDKKTSSELFSKALELRLCADSWEPDVMLLGNVTADTIKQICSDYARLRLQSGISDEIDD